VNLTGMFLGTKLAVLLLRDRGRTSPHGSAIWTSLLSPVTPVAGPRRDGRTAATLAASRCPPPTFG